LDNSSSDRDPRQSRTACFARHLALALCLSGASTATYAQSGPIAERDDAYVSQRSSNVWAIGNRGIELVLTFDAQQTLVVQRLWNPQTQQDWDFAQGADFNLTIGAKTFALSADNETTSFVRATAEANDHGVVLALVFDHRPTGAAIVRYYAAYPGSPTIETWTRVAAGRSAEPIAVTDLVGFQLTMPAGRARWVTGLRGSTSDQWSDHSFVVESRDLNEGEDVLLVAERRSSELFVPVVFVDQGTSTFFAGVIWSGAWRIGLERRGAQLKVWSDFSPATIHVTSERSVELPHAFFGVTAASTESAALRRFVVQGIRRGREFEPLVTYNTWFPYGITVTEDDLDDEMWWAAALGIELFVLDAGWYEGAGRHGPYDFTSGLGTWRTDRGRFPADLVGLADRAHALGLRFGLWVEPERVALSALNEDGLAQEEWLAMSDGSYGHDESAQICLSAEQARRWVLTQLIETIDRVRPDYLKWDNNFWINCNRAGHGHGPEEGNFAHVSALYSVLDELRRRYPAMLIENVSGGGNRLDYGMLAYSDVGWMDDNTSPASRVRHNLEGLALVFPPAYLLSFVINDEGEPLVGGDDAAQLIRSRMPGILGLTYRVEDLVDELVETLTREIATYKLVRDTVARAHADVLSDQVPLWGHVDDGTRWDVIQETTEDGTRAVIFAFKADGHEGGVHIRPRHLLADREYEVRSIGHDAILSGRGDVLMRNGIEVFHEEGSRAHVLMLTARAPE
jgi:alpha-galactosidase